MKRYQKYAQRLFLKNLFFLTFAVFLFLLSTSLRKMKECKAFYTKHDKALQRFSII